MSKGANPSIGTVPCPISGCKETAQVKKFAHRATRDTQKRYAGKLFCVCPVHGRFGGEGNSAFQEYILENATICRSDDEPAPAAKPAPAQASSPARASQAPQPSAKPAPAPTQEPKPAPKKTGWGGFFE